jgi:anti-anti-sigma factor
MQLIDKGMDNDAHLLAVSGRIDAMSAPEFEKQVTEIIEQGGRLLVIDLSELEYISSAGLRSFLVIAKKIKAASGLMKLCAMQDTVKEVFEISGFDAIIPVCKTVTEAMA